MQLDIAHRDNDKLDLRNMRLHMLDSEVEELRTELGSVVGSALGTERSRLTAGSEVSSKVSAALAAAAVPRCETKGEKSDRTARLTH